jgi:hypothetical protein
VKDGGHLKASGTVSGSLTIESGGLVAVSGRMAGDSTLKAGAGSR